jgi:Ser/Thr protein kinase RdoA (MazF antagonist)
VEGLAPFRSKVFSCVQRCDTTRIRAAVMQARGHDSHHLQAVAGAFHAPESIESITPLGSGNVNDTFLVRAAGRHTVLQRINTQVFRQPQLVMQNLMALSSHVGARLRQPLPALEGRRWELPEVITTQAGDPLHACSQGGFWRTLSFIAEARSVDVIEGPEQARELGFGLGLFHLLINDLPTEQLADTLEGFHVTPLYLEHYHQALVRSELERCERTDHCIAFIRNREAFASVLENARARGELKLRPIHGDPKINNVMLDGATGQAVGLVDLDTVKPGLIHYDIGDCLRSCCNRAGEDTTDLAAVQFDAGLAAAILEGYFSIANGFLSDADIAYIVDAARLISFELGLRFFSDYLAGNTYFKVSDPQQNLHRALVQFRLTESIEAQEPELRALVQRLRRQAVAA